ncbi:MAG TPA: proline--tRNA ligase [Eubacteriales bacterium]|nr:proline--tRNA ligase [Eubacteriales bacterium]
MRMSELIGERYKEKPADCTIESHALMVRGGYIKQVNTGVYTLLPPARRITQKIERIIREEMDRIGGQEVLFPVVLPAELWKESGRFTSVGKELVRLTDRMGADMVLGMTHEEAAVHLARDAAKSYAKYPFMIYQIQTKFRDEPRARGGLIRVREFTMKDAYSFHTSQKDLEAYYERCYEAYERIFKRAGCKNVIAVLSDSGMMGGSISHEFMLLTDIGEDTLVVCENCDFKANLEAAETVVDNSALAAPEELTLVPTPGMATIEEVAGFLKKPHSATCKAVVYQKNEDDSYVIVFIRGDMEVNETKLRNYLCAEVHAGEVTPESGIVAGFIGPMGLDEKKITVVFDRSLEGIGALVCGANKADHHYTGFNIERDYGKVRYADVSKAVSGGICPVCGKRTLTIRNGIEVGNIFQLGTKYTKAMNMQYLDENGELHYPIMGCYGIGVGRLAASVCEESHDDYGPLWPIGIAPWEAQVCVLRADQEEPKRIGNELYDALQKAGVETIIDDRQVSAGVVFSEADLIGAPIRLTVSPRNLANGAVELTTRDKSVKRQVPLEEAVQAVLELKAELFEQLKA